MRLQRNKIDRKLLGKCDLAIKGKEKKKKSKNERLGRKRQRAEKEDNQINNNDRNGRQELETNGDMSEHVKKTETKTTPNILTAENITESETKSQVEDQDSHS